MILTDYHMHSTFSDGENSPEEMVQSAIARGLTAIGISDHGYAPYDTDCCMKKENILEYKAEIARLKEKYEGQIKIYCGIEQDIFSEESTEGYDYVIGSVHYLKLGEQYYCVDWQPESIKAAAEHFGGDIYAVCEEYFRTVSLVVEKTNCDIIGHFDLISKLNDKYRMFRENNERYVAAWQKAADILIASGKIFEVNTGAITRGYKTSPYPEPSMMQYIAERGGRFILSSDTHSSDNICGLFMLMEAQCANAGISLIDNLFI